MRSDLTMAEHTMAFVSTFPPRRCGIATFTRDLINAVTENPNRVWEPLGVAITNCETLSYDNLVRFKIRSDKPKDYRRAADVLNAQGVDLVCIQHEFGLFGGPNRAGEYLLLFLSRLEAPIVTTLHTVLDKPSSINYQMVRALCTHSERVVVMCQHGADMLKRIYGISASRIEIIPHGVPDVALVPTEPAKRTLGLEGQTTILTSGLIGPGKGIETMLKAMPEIIKHIPNALYIVLGATHPNLLKTEGEQYRYQLERLVRKFDLVRHVVFENRYVDQQRLCDYLLAADFYVTPYSSERQITSGTLAYAVGTGRVVISTPYWHAKELLADGSGRLVAFENPEALADSIVDLSKDSTKYQQIREKAYRKGRRMTWPVVGKMYRELFSAVMRRERTLAFATEANQRKEQRTQKMKIFHPSNVGVAS